MSHSRIRVAAAIPCYNEARFIAEVVSRVRKHVDLVVVVDDGSTDGTAALAERAGALVVRHDTNRGKGVAMNTAFAKARELGVEAMVLLDGDGQHDPDEVPLVLQPVLSGEADVAIGSRFLNGGKGIPLYRTIGQRILTLVANLGTSMKMTDTQSGFRAYSPKALATLHFNQRQLGCVESEMQFLIRKKGLKALEVPITAIYRERAKRNPVAQGLGTFWPTLRLALRYRPTIFSALGGAALSGLGTAGVMLLAVAGLPFWAPASHWSSSGALSLVAVGLLVVLGGSIVGPLHLKWKERRDD